MRICAHLSREGYTGHVRGEHEHRGLVCPVVVFNSFSTRASTHRSILPVPLCGRFRTRRVDKPPRSVRCSFTCATGDVRNARLVLAFVCACSAGTLGGGSRRGRTSKSCGPSPCARTSTTLSTGSPRTTRTRSGERRTRRRAIRQNASLNGELLAANHSSCIVTYWRSHRAVFRSLFFSLCDLAACRCLPYLLVSLALPCAARALRKGWARRRGTSLNQSSARPCSMATWPRCCRRWRPSSTTRPAPAA